MNKDKIKQFVALVGNYIIVNTLNQRNQKSWLLMNGHGK